jgi:hypothetical protein
MPVPDVWYAIPTMRLPGQWSSLPKWQAAGYKIALFQDVGSAELPCDFAIHGEYRGYPDAVNALCRYILVQYPETNIIITGGDDIDPDPAKHPWEIQEQFLTHFSGTFGVMQPTGDRWMVNPDGLCACERVLESPWMGREWVQRINGGQGPIWPEYFHFFEDEEHREVAMNLGKLWFRPDLTQYHHHWSREHRPRPEYLKPARLNWDAAKKLFDTRKNAGFPGHEPLPL